MTIDNDVPENDVSNIISVQSVDDGKSTHYWLEFSIVDRKTPDATDDIILVVKFYDNNHVDYCIGFEMRANGYQTECRCFVKAAYSDWEIMVIPQVYYMHIYIDRTSLDADIHIASDDTFDTIFCEKHGNCTEYWNAGWSAKLTVHSGIEQRLKVMMSDVLDKQLSAYNNTETYPSLADKIVVPNLRKWGALA